LKDRLSNVIISWEPNEIVNDGIISHSICSKEEITKDSFPLTAVINPDGPWYINIDIDTSIKCDDDGSNKIIKPATSRPKSTVPTIQHKNSLLWLWIIITIVIIIIVILTLVFTMHAKMMK